MNVARKYHIVPMICWIGLGVFAMFASYRLGLGGLGNPGPGLMPFLLGLLLCVTAVYTLFTFLHEKMDRGTLAVSEAQHPTNFGRLGLVLASILAYSLFFERLGFLVTTFVALLVLFRIMNNRWFTAVVVSVVTALVSYGLFTYLGVQFPKGILKGL